MKTDLENVYFVDSSSDPVVLKIKGRASYLNCNPLNDFFDSMRMKSVQRIIIDFEDCTGMDSTFLGLITGVALEFQEADEEACLALCHLGKRNWDLVHNLGLDKILQVIDNGITNDGKSEELQPVTSNKQVADSKTILKAHENLVIIQGSNESKFQDVITFLKGVVKD
ncbi:MAG: hypothetical protein COX01_04245 [Verrucomicrobia bacterium CG22_combo_CG10-13_8_21_14_all_43_17]|nr:MAG: hypothetical protein COX01_04245 [Verrucomicrobia bacterium CG22_combo_CG10-13_8_21_14_all_43_17]